MQFIVIANRIKMGKSHTDLNVIQQAVAMLHKIRAHQKTEQTVNNKNSSVNCKISCKVKKWPYLFYLCGCIAMQFVAVANRMQPNGVIKMEKKTYRLEWNSNSCCYVT